MSGQTVVAALPAVLSVLREDCADVVAFDCGQRALEKARATHTRVIVCGAVHIRAARRASSLATPFVGTTRLVTHSAVIGVGLESKTCVGATGFASCAQAAAWGASSAPD